MMAFSESNWTQNGTSTCQKEAHDEIKKILVIGWIGYVCALLTIFMVVNEEVTSPYMDEVFHMDQARSYCVGNFSYWNQKITTPPGLYLTTLGFLKPFSELYAFGEEDSVKICPTFMLRFINLVFAVANSYLMYLIGWNLHQSTSKVKKVNVLLSAFSLSTFPPLFFFTFLYYTDSGSLFFVLLMYLFHINNHEWLASVFGCISLLYRQTNIVWMFFLASYTSLKYLNRVVEKAKRKTKFSQLIISASPQILMSCGGYAIIGSAFVAFIVYNKGIVLGDRSAHEAALHLAQMLYFLGFLSFFAFPWIYTSNNLKKFIGFSTKHSMKLMAATVLMLLVINKFTYIHPYLLADNRHYTFYIWRRVLGRQDSILPYLYIPIYIFTGWSALNLMQRKERDILWKSLFVLSIGLSIVPQQLLEFRYFLTPFIIWRLNVVPNSSPTLIIEFLFNTTVNALTLYLFLYKSFKWNHNEEVQRFMW